MLKIFDFKVGIQEVLLRLAGNYLKPTLQTKFTRTQTRQQLQLEQEEFKV
jgi:hypothetical protein